MWIISKETIRDLVTKLFSETEISRIYESQKKSPDPWVSFGSKLVQIKVHKSLFYFVHDEYDPDKWNPFPRIQPPCERHYSPNNPYRLSAWLVQDRQGRMKVMDYRYRSFLHGTSGWSETKESFDVVAFRKLPERYQPEPANETRA